MREGAYGLGATQWEVIQSQVLPAAMPGILTGTVLGIARALGEAAPLLVIGAVGFYTTSNQDFVEQLRGAFSALPMNIARFAREPGGRRGCCNSGAFAPAEPGARAHQGQRATAKVEAQGAEVLEH